MLIEADPSRILNVALFFILFSIVSHETLGRTLSYLPLQRWTFAISLLAVSENTNTVDMLVKIKALTYFKTEAAVCFVAMAAPCSESVLKPVIIYEPVQEGHSGHWLKNSVITRSAEKIYLLVVSLISKARSHLTPKDLRATDVRLGAFISGIHTFSLLEMSLLRSALTLGGILSWTLAADALTGALIRLEFTSVDICHLFFPLAGLFLLACSSMEAHDAGAQWSDCR